MTAVLSAKDVLRHSDAYTSHGDQLDFSSSSVDWRTKYVEVADILAETRNELEDFQHSSKELEEELERELERAEKLQKDLKLKAGRAESERDEWKAKFMSLQTTHNTTTTSLQRELDMLRQEQQKTKIQLRDLEMGNDDLERNERAISSSLADAESKYGRALEEKILLEHELLDKASLEEECQRLKDELRDANEEISILKEQAASATRSVPSRASEARTDISSSSALSAELTHSRRTSRIVSNMGPPGELQLSDLSPSKRFSQSKPRPPSPSKRQVHASVDLNASTRGPSAIARRTGLMQSTSRPGSSSSTSISPGSLTRSTTAPAGKLTSSTTVNPRTNFGNRTNLLTPAAKAVGVPVPKSKGVQMVTEMRARVKNLEQKIHTRVPRLRMGSVVGGRPTALPTPPVPAPPTNRSSVASTRSTSSTSSRNSSPLDLLHLTKRQSVDIDAEKRRSATAAGDTSGWVLIMEDSPSPMRDREKLARDRQRSESPSERAAASRPFASSSTIKAGIRGLGQSTSTRPAKVSAGGMSRSKSTSARLSVNTERSASASTTSSTMSIPTPTSQPSTPTSMHTSGNGLFSSTTTIGNSAYLKRSQGPPSSFYPKRSSLSASTSSPSGIRPPSAGGFYSSFLAGLEDDDARFERELTSQSTATVRPSVKDSSLNKSRIGRLADSTSRRPALADLGMSTNGGSRTRTISTTRPRPKY